MTTFTWDEAKRQSNLVKHGVDFDEAQTVFEDSMYVDFDDPDHSDEEERYIIVGNSAKNRLLLVCYTERSNTVRETEGFAPNARETEGFAPNARETEGFAPTKRLISARETTKRERAAFEEGNS